MKNKLTLNDLPISQKRIIFDTAFCNSIMVRVLSYRMFGGDINLAHATIASWVCLEFENNQPSDSDVEFAIDALLKSVDSSSSPVHVVPLFPPDERR